MSGEEVEIKEGTRKEGRGRKEGNEGETGRDRAEVEAAHPWKFSKVGAYDCNCVSVITASNLSFVQQNFTLLHRDVCATHGLCH